MFKNRFLFLLGTITSLTIFLFSCKPADKSAKQTNSEGKNILISNINPLIEHSKVLIFRQSKSQLKDISNSSKTAFGDTIDLVNTSQINLLTDSAKILAGMQISDRSELSEIKNTIAWSNHRQTIRNSWMNLETEQLAKIRQWQKYELSRSNSGAIETILNPFSNSNFLYTYSLFPQGKEFILFGLEPVGNLPNLQNLADSELDTILETARENLTAILPELYLNSARSQNLQTRTALPALCVFLVRTNNRIIDLKDVGIDREGMVAPLTAGMIPGIRITFITQGESQPKYLYYFSTELSNTNLEKYPELVKFLSEKQNIATHLNAASYLMHFDSYSTVRKLILSNSDRILQDDSGIPIDAIDSEQWQLKFYGNYARPTGIFDDKYQLQLWKIYNSEENIYPLDFAIGYQQKQEQSNLILVESKNNSKTKK